MKVFKMVTEETVVDRFITTVDLSEIHTDNRIEVLNLFVSWLEEQNAKEGECVLCERKFKPRKEQVAEAK